MPWIPAIVLLAGTVVATPLTPSQRHEIDHGFVCPERLPDDVARLRAISLFMDKYARLVPTATVNDRLAYRARLLARHHCAATDTHYSFPQT